MVFIQKVFNKEFIRKNMLIKAKILLYSTIRVTNHLLIFPVSGISTLLNNQ